MTRRRLIAISILAPLALLLLAIAYFGLTAWGRLPEYTPTSVPASAKLILGADGYAQVIDTHERPYVFDAALAPGAVLVYGAEHTKDPSDPRLGDIEARWNAFRPSVALVESRLGTMFPQLMDPVRTFGEPGLVHALARRDGVRTYTWEPPNAVLVRSALDQGLTREQAALRFHLGPYFSNLRHGRPENPEAFVRDTFADRNRWEGIEGVFESVEDLDRAWDREFPDGPDWRDVSDQFALPGFLARVDLNLARDTHMVAIIHELASRGERVFVVCGSSHAVKVRPALQAP